MGPVTPPLDLSPGDQKPEGPMDVCQAEFLWYGRLSRHCHRAPFDLPPLSTTVGNPARTSFIRRRAVENSIGPGMRALTAIFNRSLAAYQSQSEPETFWPPHEIKPMTAVFWILQPRIQKMIKDNEER